MELPLPRLYGAELVIGLVGRIGIDTRRVASEIETLLHDFGYQSKLIQVSDHVREIRGLPPLKETPTEERYASRIDACNKLREISGRDDILAFTSIIEIKKIRRELDVEVGDYAKRCAFIVNQLKRTEEILLFRQVYGSQFIQISCHAERKTRQDVLLRKLHRDHLSVHEEDKLKELADKLIDRDNDEEGQLHGQRVRDTIPLADLVINADNKNSMKESLGRFFRALFGDFSVSPTRQEYGMYLATIAALRSVDSSRQVGACILSNEGETLALGCNEVPKAGGGTYWYKDKSDGRDIFRDQDENTVRKRAFLFDVIRRLKEANKLSEDLLTLGKSELVDLLIDRKDAILGSSPILDILEFNRNLHAEMNAITDAARLGMATKGANLYTTTFPCHNCAKHIVGAGIREVFYMQPYPKSQVDSLFTDSISVVGPDKEKIWFRQFIGITPRRYRTLFEKERLKDNQGVIKEWAANEASPLVDVVFPVALLAEDWAIAEIAGSIKEEVRDQLLGGTASNVVLR